MRPLQQAHVAVVKGAEWWLEVTRPFLPGVGNGVSSKQLGEFVDQAFDSAARVLEAQRDFAKAVVVVLDEGVAGRAAASPKASRAAAA